MAQRHVAKVEVNQLSLSAQWEQDGVKSVESWEQFSVSSSSLHYLPDLVIQVLVRDLQRELDERERVRQIMSYGNPR